MEDLDLPKGLRIGKTIFPEDWNEKKLFGHTFFWKEKNTRNA
jgi:hypothetical protein